MRTKRAFVPSSLGGMDRLEDRKVLSHGIVMSQGAVVLTAHAYSKTSGEPGCGSGLTMPNCLRTWR